MATRPLVTVYSGTDGKASETQIALPAVMSAPIRTDVVKHVHRDMNKNARQAYGVSTMAGHQTSAESWGTGRAVARIPRVPGGGTHRAGQGAFGNMCRGGRMFAPTKTWRRWHRVVNRKQRRFAVASALAASASAPLVMARGHRIEGIPEVPLVVSDQTIADIEKTKTAISLLKTLGAEADLERVKDSKKLRPGKGKMRNRRYVQKRGPLIIYNEKSPMTKAFRNIPGVSLISVNRLNLLYLAPGGHVGRFCIWTQSAFERLDSLFGTYTQLSTEKKGFALPAACITNSDLARLLSSDELRAVTHDPKKTRKGAPLKKNALKNRGYMTKLNPHAKPGKPNTVSDEAKKQRMVDTRKRRKEVSKRRASFYQTLLSDA